MSLPCGSHSLEPIKVAVAAAASEAAPIPRPNAAERLHSPDTRSPVGERHLSREHSVCGTEVAAWWLAHSETVLSPGLTGGGEWQWRWWLL